MGTMLGCRSVSPSLPSRRNWAAACCRLVGVAEAASQDLERDDLARLAMHGAEHPGEGAGPHGVEHFVGAVEKARPLAFGQAFDLVVGHVLAAEELLLHVLQGRHDGSLRTPRPPGTAVRSAIPSRVPVARVVQRLVEPCRVQAFSAVETQDVSCPFLVPVLYPIESGLVSRDSASFSDTFPTTNSSIRWNLPASGDNRPVPGG